VSDILVEYFIYLFRYAGRLRRLRRTTDWRTAQGTIYYSKATGGVVETVFSYQFDGGYYSGRDNRDFFWSNSARDYLSRFPIGALVVLRVSPADPEQIAFRDDDQALATKQ
jgi:hypothetical protein